VSGFLVINPHSGKGVKADELRDEAENRGVQTHLLSPGDDPAELARAAPEGPLGVAGGDGSLAAVAQVAIDRGLPFVVIPFGTRNHFARDLGLDRDDPLAALAAFESADEKGVDVGRANGRLFLNNVSLGIYARLVHRRELHRSRRDAFARLRAVGILLRRPGSLGITVDGRPVEARVVLVANNHYKLELFSIGERERLDEGLLHLYAAAGWLPTKWEERTGGHFVVEAAAGRMRAAVDGEPEELETPIKFEIDPVALRVLVPPGA
jgi:diacylglycerol kinase family enzyme